MKQNEIFGPYDGPAPDFLRTLYDKEFQKLITADFGEIRPCFVDEVTPGDSVRIMPMCAIRSQPIVFPIQTRIKMYCHFFYGRYRILYKDWEDFYFNTQEGLEQPYLDLNNLRAKQMVSTNSLGDNLGVSSTHAGSFQETINVPMSSGIAFGILRKPAPSLPLVSPDVLAAFLEGPIDWVPFDYLGYTSDGIDMVNSMFYAVAHFYKPSFLGSKLFGSIGTADPSTSMSSPIVMAIYESNNLTPEQGSVAKIVATVNVVGYNVSEGIPNTISVPNDIRSLYNSDPTSYVLMIARSGITNYVNNNLLYNSTLSDSNPSAFQYQQSIPFPYLGVVDSSFPTVPLMNLTTSGLVDRVIDATDDRVIALNKYIGGENAQIPLLAYPFRLYEFICNYFYRNDTNNPFMIDGVPQYNKFIPTDVGGPDTNLYVIHYRNWESDPFTTAVPSPQYGTAPLVGLTYSGGDTAQVKTQVTDAQGNVKELNITVGVDEDQNISSILQVDEGVPSGSIRRLMDGVDGIKLGMSINDFRNVNAFQRFKENMLRRGLRYRNQLLAHFGVSVDYPDIDIPQFIGGFSGDLTVRQVTNMAESATAALGDVSGQIDARIDSNHEISCYCPEYGLIMGVFSIVPVPTYSQLLPPMFTRYNYLDYFQQEFNKIGYVPIFHRNFLPLQTDDPSKILGYQIAWWDYKYSVDQVNGDFRLSLSDFVLYRVFKDMPSLNPEFLTVQSDSLNNIFAVDKVEQKYKNAKKFMLQFYFYYSKKSQVSNTGTPSLE